MRPGRRTAPGDSGPSAGPGHIPVLLDEVLAALAVKPGMRVIDGTFGAGGYTRAVLDATHDVMVLALDRDPTAIAAGRAIEAQASGRLLLAECRFGDLAELAEAQNFAPVDGIVLDIGVSSMQLDEAGRGFSFMAEGPLDMRMERRGASAADLVNGMAEAALADLIYRLGEERQSRRIARTIVKAREKAPIETTRQLAEIVERAIGRKPGDDRHPATRTFQALRIAVNDELGELVRGLSAAERVLAPGGRLVVVTFHSLEDRIVKRFLARRTGRLGQGSRHGPPAVDQERGASFQLINHRPVTPSDAELAANPRARSAKLRAAERRSAPAWPAERPDELGLPETPDWS
ncbi:MAG: 16S rRNA (cytosine(1402)-N(4))-methyltransferase RsmH [Hyphomicrobiaceae bacterium]|nr:16S rRNA (cytosine(1402)-N(4))-methyltransferase RsmH [Hyphomicrobiaceae bacterium]